MPRLAIDYSKNINYKLCCLDQSITDIYVGQTTDFTNRKRQHKQNCNNDNNRAYTHYIYQFIREHGGWDNWQMIQIEEYSCKNKREAEARETQLMKELKSTLNSRPSFITKEDRNEYLKEYRNTDTRKEFMKEYQKNDKNKEYRKKYYQRKALYLNELKNYNLD